MKRSRDPGESGGNVAVGVSGVGAVMVMMTVMTGGIIQVIVDPEDGIRVVAAAADAGCVDDEITAFASRFEFGDGEVPGAVAFALRADVVVVTVNTDIGQ